MDTDSAGEQAPTMVEALDRFVEERLPQVPEDRRHEVVSVLDAAGRDADELTDPVDIDCHARETGEVLRAVIFDG